MTKKFRVSKLPHLAGDKHFVQKRCEVFMEAIVCRVTITKLGFNLMNSNRPFPETSQKEYGVSIKTFPEFVTITGFISEDICIVKSKVQIC